MLFHHSIVFAGLLLAQAASAFQPQAPSAQKPDRIVLPDVTVVAQKEPAKAQTLPVSVTAVTAEMLARAGVSIISDAAVNAPNVIFTEFTAR